MALKYPYKPRDLIRVKDTPSQVGLSMQERRVNVQNAFRANSAVVKGKKVLLVDDVATTGSTLEAGAQALLLAAADRVYGLTLARAVYNMDFVDQA